MSWITRDQMIALAKHAQEQDYEMPDHMGIGPRNWNRIKCSVCAQFVSFGPFKKLSYDTLIIAPMHIIKFGPEFCLDTPECRKEKPFGNTILSEKVVSLGPGVYATQLTLHPDVQEQLTIKGPIPSPFKPKETNHMQFINNVMKHLSCLWFNHLFAFKFVQTFHDWISRKLK